MNDARFAAGEPFEADLRTVLGQMAPRAVPESLREFLVQVAARPTRSRAPWSLTTPRILGAAALLAIVLAAAVVIVGSRLLTGPGSSTPTPHSSIISSFVEQTDGLAGYQMLRPANWTTAAGDPTDGRFYLGPGPANAQQGIVISVLNLKLAAASVDANTVIAQWLLFQQDSSLAGWTAGIEAMWSRDSESFTLLRALPHARVYLLVPVAGSPSPVILVAYAIDQGQPLVLELQASGTEADLTRLEAEGIVDDFATMVGSITALPENPQDVSPSLPAGPGPGPS